MPKILPPRKLAQTSDSVKPCQIPLFESKQHTMIHHNVSSLPSRIIICNRIDKPYGVSSVPRSHRVLSPGLFRKRYDDIRRFLDYQLGMTPAMRCVTMRLLWFWAYYGKVYPKESTITELPGCSKATYWRAIRFLKENDLVHVINRYVIRAHAQISNLYRFDRLMIILARYLAERGVVFWEEWLKPLLRIPGSTFWSTAWSIGFPSLEHATFSGFA